MKRKINCTLLIDDDMISNFISEKVIQRSDITNELKIAQNGHAAFEYIEKCASIDDPCPELIFLDINMPVMDAYDFLRLYNKLQKKNKGCIIILTSSDNPHDFEHLLKFEVKDYISKPLTYEKIDDLMKKYYGW